MKEKDILSSIDEKRSSMQEILDGLEKGEEKRTVLNEDEQARFDALKGEIESLGVQLRNIQAMAAIPKAKEDLGAIIAKSTQGRSKGDKEIDLKNRFNISKALSALKGDIPMEGAVREAHEHATEELRDMGKPTGDGINIPSFFSSAMPMSPAEAQSRIELSNHDYEKLILEEQKRILTVGTNTAGGHAVATHTQEMVEFLRPDLQVEQAGARVLTGLTGDIKFPRQSSIPSIAWEGENDSTASMQGALETFSLTPKRASGYSDVSDQLRIQGMTNWNADQFVITDLNYAVAYGVEDVAFEGGASDAPVGITQTSGIGSVALGTNGAAITWPKAVEFITDLAGANAYKGSLALFITPELAGAMFTVKRDAGSGIFIMSDPGNSLFGHPVYWSNVLPKDLTKGTGAGLHAAIFGDMSQLIIAQFGATTLLLDPYTQALTGTTRFVINSYWDIGVRHPESFSAILDFDPTA